MNCSNHTLFKSIFLPILFCVTVFAQHFNVEIDETGESTLFIFQSSIDGLVAGDEESFEVFKELFDPVISVCHGGHVPDAKHLIDL